MQVKNTILLTTLATLATATPTLPNPLGSAPSLPVSVQSLPVSSPSLPVSVPSLPVPAPSLPVSVPSLPVPAPSLPVSPPSLPVSAPPLPVSAPAIPASVSLGVPAPATSIINSVVSQAGATGLPVIGGLSSVPSVAVPTDLPTSAIPGLPIDPSSLASSITEVIQVLQLILSLLGDLGSGDGLPTTSTIDAGIQGAIIASLVALAGDLLPSLP